MDAYEKFVSTIEEILLTSSTEAGIIEMEEVQSYNSEVSDELMKLENEAKELRLVFEKQLAEASSLMMQVDAKTEE
jgi:hypothetical protein